MNSPLFQEIFHARQRVYAIGQPTPLERLHLPSLDAEVFLKREDISPINAYKWRGAYNRMAMLTPGERERGVITASAGNHAQGVALAARYLETKARIYMPVSAPRMKQNAVRRHGADWVEIILHGDNFDAAAEKARAEALATSRVYVPAYDDLAVMGGQGTIADEIVMSGKGPFDVAYLQVGGGGMAAAVATWLKEYYPNIRIVGVEGVGQASMAAAVAAGGPVTLENIDVFCDGTAVKRAGDLTFGPCSKLIDEFITVTNEEVCNAIQIMWEGHRVIPEPAGAMGLAGLLKQEDNVRGKRAVVVICGANMDFGRLAWIARHAGIGASRRRYYKFRIPEVRGSLLHLLESFMEGINIIEFQYGKTDKLVAQHVIGIEASPPELDLLDQRLIDHGIAHEDVTSREDVEFRIIKYDARLFQLPLFVNLNFPERAGALHDFLAVARDAANICYFNYVYTGEEVGRAMLGVEFESTEQREAFRRQLRESGLRYHEVSLKALDGIL